MPCLNQAGDSFERGADVEHSDRFTRRDA